MDRTQELIELLRANDWKQDENGDYVRGTYYLALLPRGVIHVGQRPAADARPDTNRWGQARTVETAIEWVVERSREDA